MDFNVNVKFDATPALVGAVSTLATALGGGIPLRVQKTIVTDGAVSFAPVSQAGQGETTAPTAEAPEQAASETTAPAQSTVIADEVVREAVAVQAKAGKKDKIKMLLAEFGVKSSPGLPQERRAEFIQKISAL